MLYMFSFALKVDQNIIDKENSINWSQIKEKKLIITSFWILGVNYSERYNHEFIITVVSPEYCLLDDNPTAD